MNSISTQEFRLDDITAFKKKAKQWSDQFEYVAILENNNVPYLFDPFVNVVAVGAREVFITDKDPFEQLKVFLNHHKTWTFGYFSYDLKNQIEKLSSSNPDFQEQEEICFFIPEHLIFIGDEEVKILSKDNPENVLQAILDISAPFENGSATVGPYRVMDKQRYIEKVEKIKEHIINGDIYELNFCIEFAFENTVISPRPLFEKLIEKSPMPFSFYLRVKNHYIISASPERFLKKKGDQLISQPIKGTIKRGKDEAEDEELKIQLRNSEKELAENLMIVDLVRNDLARSSIPGSVKVEELFGVYTFKQLHQMISTVTSTKRETVDPIEVIKNAFPMGSMTGAPKIRAMELIEYYEEAKRGVFSGAAGYFAPDMDFDLNVLIRTIFYNEASKRLSFQVGSAITYDADPEYEYNECLLKASAILEILGLKDLGS